MTRETVHRCPPGDKALTPCCRRPPFELPRTDRMTEDASLVTCDGTPPFAVPLRVDWAGCTGTVHVDGLDISHVVYGVTVRGEGGGLPEVTLDLLPSALQVDADTAQVVVDDQTRAVLVRLGWTPPR